jgi:hypothetical protein
MAALGTVLLHTILLSSAGDAQATRAIAHQPAQAIAAAITSSIMISAAQSEVSSLNTAVVPRASLAENEGTASERRSPASAALTPRYKVQLPPDFKRQYVMRLKMFNVDGWLILRRTDSGYFAEIRGSALGMQFIQTSEGLLDPKAGFVPRRFSDQRPGKPAQAALFESVGNQITFSGGAEQVRWMPGIQDRLSSWMLQLPAILAARDINSLKADQTFSMWVVGAKGEADIWHFAYKGLDNVSSVSGRGFRAARFIRLPRKPNDTRVEVWLDVQNHFIPVKAVIESAEIVMK